VKATNSKFLFELHHILYHIYIYIYIYIATVCTCVSKVGLRWGPVFGSVATWQVVCDNYLDGGYHVPFAHKGLAEGLDLDR
jgi:hypothetical protein